MTDVLCLVTCAALSLSLAAAAPDVPTAARRPIALLPVAAERVSLESMPLLQRLNDVLRLGARDVPGVELQDQERTRANLASVRDMGIGCDVDDAACLGKVAVLLDVELVVVPIARIERDRTALRVLVVGIGGAHAEASADLAAEPVPKETRRVIEAALAAYAAAPLPADPAPTPPPVPAAAAAPAPARVDDDDGPAVVPVPEPGVSPMLLAGGVVTGAGALLLAGGAAGALTMNALLEAKEPYAARFPKMVAGQVLVGAAAVGAAAGLTGGAMLAAAAME